ncbi:hypothetical protein SNEBB_002153 [Seison nebaliae]|nr:hypothetical protein SNEBB_002153 [Seison nebaliae]
MATSTEGMTTTTTTTATPDGVTVTSNENENGLNEQIRVRWERLLRRLRSWNDLTNQSPGENPTTSTYHYRRRCKDERCCCGLLPIGLGAFIIAVTDLAVHFILFSIFCLFFFFPHCLDPQSISQCSIEATPHLVNNENLRKFRLPHSSSASLLSPFPSSLKDTKEHNLLTLLHNRAEKPKTGGVYTATSQLYHFNNPLKFLKYPWNHSSIFSCMTDKNTPMYITKLERVMRVNEKDLGKNSSSTRRRIRDKFPNNHYKPTDISVRMIFQICEIIIIILYLHGIVVCRPNFSISYLCMNIVWLVINSLNVVGSRSYLFSRQFWLEFDEKKISQNVYPFQQKHMEFGTNTEIVNEFRLLNENHNLTTWENGLLVHMKCELPFNLFFPIRTENAPHEIKLLYSMGLFICQTTIRIYVIIIIWTCYKYLVLKRARQLLRTNNDNNNQSNENRSNNDNTDSYANRHRFYSGPLTALSILHNELFNRNSQSINTERNDLNSNRVRAMLLMLSNENRNTRHFNISNNDITMTDFNNDNCKLPKYEELQINDPPNYFESQQQTTVINNDDNRNENENDIEISFIDNNNNNNTNNDNNNNTDIERANT